MASPQRDFRPEESQPVLHAERRVEREVGTGRPFGYWWIWIPVVVAAFWFCGWGWGGYGGWWWGHGSESAIGSAQTAQAVAPPSGNQGARPANGAPSSAQTLSSGTAVLQSANKESFAGQQFEVYAIPVQNKIGNDALRVGTSGGASMLVTMPRGLTTGSIQQGTHLDITGTVEKAPAMAKAEHQWSLNAAEAQRLEKDGAYVQATQVKPVPDRS